MTKPTCYIMSGIPGCGKSTWSRKFTAEHNNIVQVSRDEIRFSLLADGEDYFAHEDEVIATFYAEINEALAAGHDVIADATHISDRALYNTLKAIRADCKMLLVSFDTPLEVCILRNFAREGRECVPTKVIVNMSKAKEKLDKHLSSGLYRNQFGLYVLHVGKDC